MSEAKNTKKKSETNKKNTTTKKPVKKQAPKTEKTATKKNTKIAETKKETKVEVTSEVKENIVNTKMASSEEIRKDKSNEKKGNETLKMCIAGFVILALIALIPISAAIKSIAGKKIVDEFNTLFQSSTNEVVYLGRPTCSYCQMLEPIMQNLKEQYNINYTYINTDQLSESQLNRILAKLDIEPANFGTPYVGIVSNSKVVDAQPGYDHEGNMFQFFQKNGFISEDIKYPVNFIDYEEYIDLINSDEKVIIVVGRTGCSNCTKIMPYLKEIAEEYEIAINYIDTAYLTQEEDESFTTSLSYLNSDDFKGTPTLLVVKDKEVLKDVVGATTKENYIEVLTEQGFID